MLFVFRFLLVWVVALQACGGELPHENPYDPASPVTKQAKAQLIGSVLLEAETDFSEIEAQLQNDDRTYSVSTGADGSLRLTGIVPGQYRLSLQTRYFEPVTRMVDIALGSSYDLGTVTLVARRAVVSGLAWAEIYAGEEVERRGGVIVRLERKASIRSAAAGARAMGPQAATPAPAYQGVSRAGGQYEISGVTPGVYNVIIEASDATESGSGGVVAGEVSVAGEPVVIDEIIGHPLSGYFTLEGVSLAGGIYLTNTWVISLLFTHNSAASVAAASFSGTAGACVYGEPRPITAGMALPLVFEGVNTVCVRYFTADGQAFDAPTRTVMLDTTPPTGSLAINGGAAYVRSNDGAVFLTLSATDALSGVARVKLANAASAGACAAALAGASAELFVENRGWQLASPGAGQNADRHVCALFGDHAGNWSTTPKTATVRYDTQIPTATVGLKGPEAISGRTRSYEIVIDLSARSADVSEMIIANDAGFTGAGWRPVADEAVWLLSPGDGLKTVFVKLRDVAGNESATYQPTITLDQTAPEAPGITMEDFDGDGFALNGDAVELRWTKASDPDLAGFELQRFVPGEDSAFITIAMPAAWEDTYLDAVTKTSGFTHFYRVRTRDLLGNVSTWSLTVQAFPYQPISVAAWLWAEDGYRYLFPPAPGTFSIRTSLSYLDFAHAEYGDELPADTPYWNRPETLNSFFDETLTIRTLNQDNSLSYLSTFRGQLKQRRRIDASPANPGIAVAPDGSSHLVYHAVSANALRHARVGEGAVEITEIDENVVESNPEIAVDANNHAHVVYTRYLNSPNRELRYATNASGTWVWQTLVATSSSFLFYPRIALGPDGRPHFLYRKSAQQLYYAAPATTGAGWNEQLISASAAGIEYAMAVSSDASAHILLCTGPVSYLTSQSGGWVTKSIGDWPDQACRPAIEAGNSHIHAAWHNRLDAMIRYATSASGWSVQDVETYTEPIPNPAEVPASVDIDVFNGRPYIAFTDYDAAGGDVHRIAYHNGGGWLTHDVDGIQSATDGSSLALDAQGNLRLAYSRGGEGHLYSGFSLVDKRVSTTVPDRNSDIALAAGPNGQPHILTQGIETPSLTYRTRQNGVWTSKLFPINVQMSPPEIAVDTANRPHVVAGHFNASFQAVSKYYWNEGGWNTVELGAVVRPTISADAEGGIHILHAGFGAFPLKYQYRGPGAPELSAAETVATGAYNGRAARDTAGAIHIAYLTQEGTTRRLRYAYRDAGTWTTEAIDATAQVDRYVIATAGETPHILYIDRNTERLYHVYRKGGAWKRVVLASGVTRSGPTNIEGALSLQIDAGGRMFALYYNDAQETFYFGFNPAGRWLSTPLAKGYMAGAAVLDPRGELHLVYQKASSNDYWLQYQTGIFGLMHPTNVERVTAW